MIGNIDTKVRPLRLGYLVDPGSAAQIHQAIRLSSSLWGGIYFPIIPLYGRMPANWVEKPFKAPPPQSVIRGYLEAFDPDILIQLSKEVPDFVSSGGLTVIQGRDIWEVLSDSRSRSPRFGIGIFERCKTLGFTSKARATSAIVEPVSSRWTAASFISRVKIRLDNSMTQFSIQ